MANGDKYDGLGRQEWTKREAAKMEKARKAKEPTVMGSLKEGAKTALKRGARLVGGGGMADKARKDIQKSKAATARAIKEQTGD